MVVSARRLGSRLLGSAAGYVSALLLAALAAHLYQPPNLLGVSRTSPWFEVDFLCSLASSALALASGVWASDRRLALRSAFRALALRTLIWFALTITGFAIWAPHLFLFTLLIAPTHAFACLRLGLCWRLWRADVTFRSTPR